MQDTRAWKISPGENAEDWPISRRRGCICLGWIELPNFAKFKSETEVLHALERAYPDEPEGNGSGAAKSIWRFAKVIEPGDVIVANEGLSRVVGIGVVESGYIPPKSKYSPLRAQDDILRRHSRRVDWKIQIPVDFSEGVFTQSTVHRLNPERCDQILKAYKQQHPSVHADLEELFAGNESSGLAKTDAHVIAKSELALESGNEFDPSGLVDARERKFGSIVRRRGQPAFRKLLLLAYEGKCAVTGCAVEDVLEAAHIVPYKGSETNHPANGLLLRADIHTLFDLGLLSIHESDLRILISNNLEGSEYRKLEGKRIRLPKKSFHQPSRDAIKDHRKRSGLS